MVGGFAHSVFLVSYSVSVVICLPENLTLPLCIMLAVAVGYIAVTQNVSVLFFCVNVPLEVTELCRGCSLEMEFLICLTFSKLVSGLQL